MNELERVACWLVLLVIVSCCGLVYMDLSSTERMAQNGYVPMRLPGDNRTYWLPIATGNDANQMLKH